MNREMSTVESGEEERRDFEMEKEMFFATAGGNRSYTIQRIIGEVCKCGGELCPEVFLSLCPSAYFTVYSCLFLIVSACLRVEFLSTSIYAHFFFDS